VRPLRVLAVCLVAVLATTPLPMTETSAASTDGASTARRTAYSVLQMNLCLSGLSGCQRYPRVVREAIRVIRARRPNAVTLNEVCRRDVARIAELTGYRARFATVLYRGRPLACRSPRGRGVFGNAVLTKAVVTASVDRRFRAQSDQEKRRWLCVATRGRQVTVCTTHLSPRGSSRARAANRRQCAEFARVLAARARRGPTIAAGDINRHGGCAPAGMWSRADDRAAQKPGLQHAYGNRRHLRRPVTRIVRARFTDHDYLHVTARLVVPAVRSIAGDWARPGP
jgi:endonuclease/exonuclease/phosphatase family metal-dependent hydrolase